MGGKQKLSKNAKRRLREKRQKEEKRRQAELAKQNAKSGDASPTSGQELVATDAPKDVEIQYISADVNSQLQSSEEFEEFQRVFDRFAKAEELTGNDKENSEGDSKKDDSDSNKSAVDAKPESKTVVKKLSKKKQRLANRLSVAELKQLVKRPDVVEVHDVTAADPRLLVYLKSYRNTVPVPRHWSLKRKYLQGKRGIEKPPFELPECIKMTGIDKVRDAFLQKESAQNSKSKARSNMTGSTGKIEIDYDVLYNAFFKFKTKPKNLTKHGDLYYESKEFETKMKNFTPGQLSDQLREALGMPTRFGEGGQVNAGADLFPPPWLINMQRYGPPPDYPKLKIPGLNAPIPSGASFGYNPGQWGKPPVDEFGQPLYGNVFDEDKQLEAAGGVDTKARWGVLVDDDDDEEDEEDDDDETDDSETEEDEDASGLMSPDLASGISSVASGLETPDTINLRKGRPNSSDDAGSQSLYQVISETKSKVGSGALFGSSHKYVIPSGGGAKSAPDASNIRDVNVAVDPEALDKGLSKDDLQKLYESQDGPSSKATLDALNATKKRKFPRSDAEGAKKKQYKSDFKF